MHRHIANTARHDIALKESALMNEQFLIKGNSESKLTPDARFNMDRHDAMERREDAARIFPHHGFAVDPIAALI